MVLGKMLQQSTSNDLPTYSSHNCVKPYTRAILEIA